MEHLTCAPWLALPLPNLQHMDTEEDGGEGQQEGYMGCCCALHIPASDLIAALKPFTVERCRFIHMPQRA